MVPFFVEAANATGKLWINQLAEPQDNANYQLTISWVGRYQVLHPLWTLRAVPSPYCDLRSAMCIDDVYGTRLVTKRHFVPVTSVNRLYFHKCAWFDKRRTRVIFLELNSILA